MSSISDRVKVTRPCRTHKAEHYLVGLCILGVALAGVTKCPVQTQQRLGYLIDRDLRGRIDLCPSPRLAATVRRTSADHGPHNCGAVRMRMADPVKVLAFTKNHCLHKCGNYQVSTTSHGVLHIGVELDGGLGGRVVKQ